MATLDEGRWSLVLGIVLNSRQYGGAAREVGAHTGSRSEQKAAKAGVPDPRPRRGASLAVAAPHARTSRCSLRICSRSCSDVAGARGCGAAADSKGSAHAGTERGCRGTSQRQPADDQRLLHAP
jgi:hypothetical protein